jgi:chromosome segregation ATPase
VEEEVPGSSNTAYYSIASQTEEPLSARHRESSIQKLSLVEEALLGIIDTKQTSKSTPSPTKSAKETLQDTAEALSLALNLLEEQKSTAEQLKKDYAVVIEDYEDYKERTQKELTRLYTLTDGLYSEQFDVFLVLKQMRMAIAGLKQENQKLKFTAQQFQSRNDELMLLAEIKTDLKGYQDKFKSPTNPETSGFVDHDTQTSPAIMQTSRQHAATSPNSPYQDSASLEHTLLADYVRQLKQDNQKLSNANQELSKQVSSLLDQVNSSQYQAQEQNNSLELRTTIEELQYKLACSKQREEFMANEFDSTTALNEQLESRLNAVEQEYHEFSHEVRENEAMLQNTIQQYYQENDELLNKLNLSEGAREELQNDVLELESRNNELVQIHNDLTAKIKECEARLEDFDDIENRLIELEALGVVQQLEKKEMKLVEEEGHQSWLTVARQLSEGLRSEQELIDLMYDTMTEFFLAPASDTLLPISPVSPATKSPTAAVVQGPPDTSDMMARSEQATAFLSELLQQLDLRHADSVSTCVNLMEEHNLGYERRMTKLAIK